MSLFLLNLNSGVRSVGSKHDYTCGFTSSVFLHVFSTMPRRVAKRSAAAAHPASPRPVRRHTSTTNATPDATPEEQLTMVPQAPEETSPPAANHPDLTPTPVPDQAASLGYIARLLQQLMAASGESSPIIPPPQLARIDTVTSTAAPRNVTLSANLTPRGVIPSAESMPSRVPLSVEPEQSGITLPANIQPRTFPPTPASQVETPRPHMASKPPPPSLVFDGSPVSLSWAAYLDFFMQIATLSAWSPGECCGYLLASLRDETRTVLEVLPPLVRSDFPELCSFLTEYFAAFNQREVAEEQLNTSSASWGKRHRLRPGYHPPFSSSVHGSGGSEGVDSFCFQARFSGPRSSSSRPRPGSCRHLCRPSRRSSCREYVIS